MKNIDFYNGNFCGVCVHGDCGNEFETCDKCRDDCGGVCPCMQIVENVDKPCKYFELNLPKQYIFNKIKQGYTAYLIGKYGTKFEKRDFTEFAECDLELMHKRNLSRLETRKVLTATIKLAFYHLGEMENEN